jgi:hypothetical protein
MRRSAHNQLGFCAFIGEHSIADSNQLGVANILVFGFEEGGQQAVDSQ